MAPLLDDIPIFHNQDHIGIFNGREPMRNHKAGPSFHQIIHSFLDPLFTDRGSVVEVFTDLSLWLGIKAAIDRINANAAVS